MQKGPMAKHEQHFLNEIKRAFKARGFHYFKIPDAPPGLETRFSVQKPYDSIAFAQGHGLCLEAKSFDGLQAVPMRRLEIGQVKGLNEAHNNGACAFVLAHFRVSRGQERAYPIPWPQMLLKACFGPEKIGALYKLGQRDPNLKKSLTGCVSKKDLETMFFFEKKNGEWQIDTWIDELILYG